MNARTPPWEGLHEELSVADESKIRTKKVDVMSQIEIYPRPS